MVVNTIGGDQCVTVRLDTLDMCNGRQPMLHLMSFAMIYNDIHLFHDFRGKSKIDVPRYEEKPWDTGFKGFVHTEGQLI